MLPKKHIIIYSHGLGVRRDDNGLLSDIADALPEVESVLFDYYDIDEVANELFICPASQQLSKLTKIINDTRLANPTAIIDLIAHSQGTIIAAMARSSEIRKAILLAPVFDVSLEKTLSRYQAKPGAELNINGISKIPSSSGLTRIIPKEYWQERLEIKPFREYNALSEKTEVIIIEANQDQLLPKVDLSELSPETKVISLDGNHGFEGEARESLIKVIREEIKI
jgi:hypothetical protein